MTNDKEHFPIPSIERFIAVRQRAAIANTTIISASTTYGVYSDQHKEKIYVVAGSYEQFKRYTLRKAGRDYTQQYVYVSGPDTLRGLSSVKGVFIGTWRERTDIADIELAIFTIKLTMKADKQLASTNKIYEEHIAKVAEEMSKEIDRGILQSIREEPKKLWTDDLDYIFDKSQKTYTKTYTKAELDLESGENFAAGSSNED